MAIAFTGIRARAVPCDPVCARCGYDLRGYAVMNNCSECGNNLTASGSIRRFTDRSSRRVVLFGLAVAVSPWAIIGYEALHRRYGYDWEKLRSNADLISLISKPGGDRKYWLWSELTHRLNTGRLPAAQVSPLIDVLTAAIQSRQNYVDPLMYSNAFFVAADNAGAIPLAKYEPLAQAFYQGPSSQGQYSAQIPHEFRANEPVTYWLDSTKHWDLPGLRRIAVPLKIEFTRPGSQPIDVMDPIPGTLRAKNVPPGAYDVTFDFRIFLIHGNRSLVVASLPPGALPVAQWDVTVKAQVEIIAYDHSGNRIPTLRTDDAANPEKTGAIKVESAVEACFADRSSVSIHFRVRKPPESIYFKPVVFIGRRQFPGNSQFVLKGDESSYLYFANCELGSERFSEGPVTIEFQPDLESATRAGWTSIWGKSLRFENILMRRRDFAGNHPAGVVIAYPPTTGAKRTN